MRRVPKRRVALGAAVVAVATLAAIRLGPDGNAGHEAGAPPQLAQQAYAVARQEFGRLSGGDWAGAWTLWAPEARRAVPQADFVRVNTTCHGGLGAPYVIDARTPTSPTAVRVDWHHAGTSGTSTVRYAAGRWGFVPDPTTLRSYEQGPAAAIRQRRAAGTCA